MLKDMHFFLKSANLTNETIAKIIILGYNLVELSKKTSGRHPPLFYFEYSGSIVPPRGLDKKGVVAGRWASGPRIKLNEKLLAVLGKDFFLCCKNFFFVAAAKKKYATLERDRNINPEGCHLYFSDTDIEKLYSHKKVALFNSYSENNKPLSLLFLLGFILGNGNFTIRIRDTEKGL